jgi:UDP-N-acetylmuramoyl-L-alanyl-D-glutamate--2,6-diaminopimelate ligase
MIFDLGIFTNIGNDHIGPGGAADFDHLIEYKGRLLKQCRTGLVNIDDPNIDRILEGHTCELKTFGLSEKADYRATGIVCEMTDGRPGVSFDVPCADLHVSVSMPGEFTVYNSLAAIGTALQLGAPEEAVLSTLREFSLPGRFRIITQKNAGADSAPTVIVDFAHNPISLQAILTNLRQYYTGRIVCVFGCGGGGSTEKRPEMGRVSTELADFVIITSDNPRFEDP